MKKSYPKSMCSSDNFYYSYITILWYMDHQGITYLLSVFFQIFVPIGIGFETIFIIRKTKKPFWKNENGKSGRKEGKTKTESSPTRTQKKDSV